MDLMDLQTADAPVWFTLTHPSTGADLEHDGKPVRIALNSPDSPVMVAHERAVQSRRLTQAGRTGRVTLKPEELDAEATEHAAAAVAGWENLSIGGSVPEFSAAQAKTLVAEPRLRWLRDWIEEKLRDRGNFIGAQAPQQTK